MSLRTEAKIPGISPAYLSYMVNGKRPWRADLKERYDTLVNAVNTLGPNENDLRTQEAVYVGAGDGIRTHDLLLGKQILYH